ncbi:phosphate ABC transporter permease PtsA [Sporosarcina sp. PTS2304]|uniref:phosphate ABC transporter permease PstA n=1 Tax=Sporosarcina sp. PTS2304 TaxID=2283194 RepID=UPI000E0D34A8|nr:phosphate ABC transporter permease PstA [Sporosarcina sp. PTS2304]AXH99418.1 phosphate ABC transporter permease PtsA [Sporosarcina sp. PTS2304]
MSAKKKDQLATTLLYAVAGIIITVLAGLLGFVFVKGMPQLSWQFITSPPQIFKEGGGVGPQLFNSFYLLVLTLMISIPIAIGAGIYLAEYAKNHWMIRCLRVLIEVLSSLPSIVVGLFGFLFFVLYMGWGFSIISGALALSVFNLPLLVRVVEQSISNVPKAQREAGWALGYSKWETITTIILPAALPGIVTGIILASGRVFGEAAALIYTAGMSTPVIDFTNWNPLSATSPLNPFRPAETMAVHIWKVNSEGIMPNAAAISDGAAALLIISILFFNFTSRIIGNAVFKKMSAN